MDWRRPTEALIPGLEGVALRQLYAVDAPQTAGDVHERAGTGSRNGIRYALDRLSDQGIVVRTTVGNTAVYELNRDHLAYTALDAALRTYSPYAELRDRLRTLAGGRTWNGPLFSLAVYGSVARGEAGPESDVDLLLVLPDGRDADDAQVDDLVEALHVAVRRWTGNRAHVNVQKLSQVHMAAAERNPIFMSWLGDADFVFGKDVVAQAKGAVG